ncbi:unnamed protein product [Allacma fusca]|uniref:Rab-GAP TBC domain-containing protein n=1 Tax=Allacma fusca TaxID=39272 RepID=A0A8J2KM86_9HEXA|nr:unnamed protein product [Allacma fusca]
MKRNRPTLKQTPRGDWRHAIFKRVLSPTSTQPCSLKENSNGGTAASTFKLIPGSEHKKTRAEIRELWRNAILQQILLNRMDKQNYILKAKQEEVSGKRVKLSYDTLGVCDDEASDTWDLVINKYHNNDSNCDLQLLDSAILRGIPKHKRGQVWQFFMQQRKHIHTAEGTVRFKPKKEAPYEHLLKQLTSHQHAILIDLGRTFPSHPFYCDPLGTGQLALFNLLKAYSILDPDVGYCQGLSFVAGILLMHFEEEEAFSALKYIMFDLGAREHYKPEMSGLQVKLYQLTRMIHDRDPELHMHLDTQDILPSLYAAPWFLTIFAAQFSVGFAVRVLDVVLLHGIDVITRFAVEIIVDHKSDLKKCTGLEQVMECFRHVVTKIKSDDVNRYLRQVLDTNSAKQLLTYAVEYTVMHDESFLTFISEGYSPPPSSATAVKPKMQNKPLSLANNQCAECLKLHVDIITLLKYIKTMRGACSVSKGSVGNKWSSHPPEISALASKYLTENDATEDSYENIGTIQSNVAALEESDVPVRLYCHDSQDSSISNKHSKSNVDIASIDIPVLQQDNNQNDGDANSVAQNNYFFY